MGCGASAGGGGGHGKVITKKSGKKYVEEAAPVEDAPPPPEKGKTKETSWHRKNCTDADLSLVYTINEAYPFDDAERMDVVKKEKVWNPASDGVKHNWGSVSVAKMQKKINCVACKGHILDRYEEAPFYFCIRCKTKGDRHLELCIECYNEGILATGARKKSSLSSLTNKGDQETFSKQKLAHDPTTSRTSNHSREENMYQQNKNSSHLAVKNRNTDERRPSNNSNNPRGDGHSASPRPARQISAPGPAMRSGGGRPHSVIPCGAWKGKMTEGASARPVNFKLFFDQSGEVSGTGPDNCEVKGSVAGDKVKWTETHSWGKNTITADIVHMPPPLKLKGTFKASDGGGGKIELALG